MAEAPGSPFVLLTQEEWEESQHVLTERDIGLERIEELEAEVASLRSTAASPIDVQALASALVVPLRQEWQRRPGPKPPKAA